MSTNMTFHSVLQIPTVGTSGPSPIGAAFPAEDFVPQGNYESTEPTEQVREGDVNEEAEDLADALATRSLYTSTGSEGFTPYREYREKWLRS